MESVFRAKRQRIERDCDTTSSSMMGCETSTNVLVALLEARRWEEATLKANENPREVSQCSNPSPLALACRYGAPYDCVRAILDADARSLRHVLDSRGTPLHEALVCETTGPSVIAALLKFDEDLGNESTRATLLQDVDGFTPLHLLIRRRFQSHILRDDEDSSLVEILEMLVRSCPESVVIPDRGEYEEPPIVYALKANIYAPSLGSEESTLVRVEQQIFEMVSCMLRHCPVAASRVFKGYRGQYTALHSAVFHGRYTNTIDLLLKTEAEFGADQTAALLANTQGELPLHFCAMRGERPRSIALIAGAAPLAITKRDATGLTPFHWLWIRFVSTLLSLDDDGRGEDTTSILDGSTPNVFSATSYSDFASLEQSDIEMDLRLIKRVDPPVDFLRMRHIPLEVLLDAESLMCSKTALQVLQRIRERYAEQEEVAVQTRQEAVISLFWTKVVSLLEASISVTPNHPVGNKVLVHTSFASASCPPSVTHLVASLFPEELSKLDDRGRLPLHYAAMRRWHAWDWPREDGLDEPTAAKLLQEESLQILRIAMNLSSCHAVRVSDNDGRLVLHHVIDSFVKACGRPARSKKENPLDAMLTVIRDLMNAHPESLHRRDGATKLFPFLQATACASAVSKKTLIHEELPLSITFALLREDPTMISSLCTS